MKMQGSLTNRIMESTPSITTPTVGMGATEILYSDRSPFTVVSVNRKGTLCAVREDTATRTDGNGMSEAQSYTYTANLEGEVRILKRNRKGQWLDDSGTVYRMGERSKYHDYSF